MEHFDGWTVAKGAWGLIVSIVAFFGTRQMNRIDKLESDRATREELKERFESLQGTIDETRAEAIRTREELREDMREHREESRGMLGRIFVRLDAMSDRSGSR